MITGASRGLGAALAMEFASAGARVSACARDSQAVVALRERLRRSGFTSVVEQADVGDPASVESWMKRTIAEFGAPSVLINNASILGRRDDLANYPITVWREVLDTNLTGALIAIQAVLPAMMQARSGAIVNVSSGAALPPRRAWGAYAISKSALETLSLNLAAELRTTGIRVNLVDPGAMRTEMRAAAYPEEDPESVKHPASIAPLFLWLASESSSGVTGERFRAEEWLDREG
jgi:NAD(P)-dependent dehydrogenase (short-subunit alcohol dehydrogenase family)